MNNKSVSSVNSGCCRCRSGRIDGVRRITPRITGRNWRQSTPLTVRVHAQLCRIPHCNGKNTVCSECSAKHCYPLSRCKAAPYCRRVVNHVARAVSSMSEPAPSGQNYRIVLRTRGESIYDQLDECDQSRAVIGAPSYRTESFPS